MSWKHMPCLMCTSERRWTCLGGSSVLLSDVLQGKLACIYKKEEKPLGQICRISMAGTSATPWRTGERKKRTWECMAMAAHAGPAKVQTRQNSSTEKRMWTQSPTLNQEAVFSNGVSLGIPTIYQPGQAPCQKVVGHHKINSSWGCTFHFVFVRLFVF